MTEAPDWVGTPYAPVHNEPARAAQWQGMSQDQLEGLRTRLVESFIQVVVQAVTGLFIPGGVTGEAYEQLVAWADGIAEALEEIPIIGDIIEVLTGVEDGDLNDLGSWVADLLDSNSLQEFLDTIWQAITGLTGTGNLLQDLFDALQHIPFINILGTGGPNNLGDALRAGWDALISGLVGTPGSGSGLADLFNIPFLVSSRATKGEWSWDILGIRNNQSLFTGFAPTSTSNLNMATLAFNKVSGTPTAPTVPITQSTALTAWHRVSQAMDLGVIGWTGSGNTSITDFRINIWGMNSSTGDITVLHHSTNQVSLLPTTTEDVLYELPTALAVEAGDLIGIELHPIGAGTHNAVGDVTWRNFNHATVVPRRWSSKRNGGTSTATPSDIVDASIDYNTTNIPFIEYGVTGASNVTLPHSPEARLFGTAGSTSTVIPSWATHIDLVAVGGGGGGEGCGFLWGQGGRAGSWTGVRLERGVEIPEATTTLDITVGEGGDGGAGFGDNGSAGTSSVVSATGMTTFTAHGGAGGSAGNADTTGQSPGNFTFGDTLFAGGTAENVYFNDGNGPGGGGAGGTVIFIQAGSGAAGGVWVVFRQLYVPDPIVLEIEPSSIASAESFGTPTVAVNQPITPSSITSEESFGTPTVTVSGLIVPSSIPSEESFGTPIITTPFIFPSSITSAESFGTPTINVANVILPSSIASAESVGTPTVEVVEELVEYQTTGLKGQAGVNSNSTQSITSAGGSHNCSTSDANTVVIAAVTLYKTNTNTPTITCTCGGVSMTLLGQVTPSSTTTALFYLFNPGTGSKTVTASASWGTAANSSKNIVVTTQSYTGVNSLTGFHTSSNTGVHETTITTPASVPVNGMAYFAHGTQVKYAGTLTYNRTQRFADANTSTYTSFGYMVTGDADGAGSALTSTASWPAGSGAVQACSVILNP